MQKERHAAAARGPHLGSLLVLGRRAGAVGRGLGRLRAARGHAVALPLLVLQPGQQVLGGQACPSYTKSNEYIM
jgi:hypothetical protein